MLFLFFLAAGRFDLFRRCAKVALDLAFLFRRGFLRRCLCTSRTSAKIIEAEPLREFQFASAFRVALHEQINAPFDFRGRTLPAASEKLVVFDLELADVPFELANSSSMVAMRGENPEPPC